MDLRQVIAALLTCSMFVMLGNMVKRDHFDTFQQMKLPVTSNYQYGDIKVTKQSLVTLTSVNKEPWTEKEVSESLKPCWNKQMITKKREQSKGCVTFSLNNGAEYHALQIADAVIVAKYLKATLVVPDITGSKPGENMEFEEIYDTEKFIRSLEGHINIAKKQTADVSSAKFIRIPNMVSAPYIETRLQPIFKKWRDLKIETHFPSTSRRTAEEIKYSDTDACLAMFGTLHLQVEAQEVIDLMVGRLRMYSRKSNGEFIAVDLADDISKKRSGCKKLEVEGEKHCYDAQEIGDFLKKIGFNRDTTIYVTQDKWDTNLDALRKIFPKTYIKKAIMPTDKKMKFLTTEFEKVIDFYICSESDVFVPGVPGMFYKSVAGKRISSGKTQILVPGEITTSTASMSNYISPYVSLENHFAYSCFC